MKKIIHHIRRQSEQTRRHILHILVIIAGIILLLIWIYSLGVNFSDKDMQANTLNDLKPFSALKNSIVDGYSSISESSANAQ